MRINNYRANEDRVISQIDSDRRAKVRRQQNLPADQAATGPDTGSDDQTCSWLAQFDSIMEMSPHEAQPDDPTDEEIADAVARKTAWLNKRMDQILTDTLSGQITQWQTSSAATPNRLRPVERPLVDLIAELESTGALAGTNPYNRSMRRRNE